MAKAFLGLALRLCALQLTNKSMLPIPISFLAGLVGVGDFQSQANGKKLAQKYQSFSKFWSERTNECKTEVFFVSDPQSCIFFVFDKSRSFQENFDSHFLFSLLASFLFVFGDLFKLSTITRLPTAFLKLNFCLFFCCILIVHKCKFF